MASHRSTVLQQVNHHMLNMWAHTCMATWSTVERGKVREILYMLFARSPASSFACSINKFFDDACIHKV